MRTDSRPANGVIERAEEIFCAALEIASSRERAAYVESSCGHDAELRAAVEGMLSSQPAVENFFQQGTVASFPIFPKPSPPRVASPITPCPAKTPNLKESRSAPTNCCRKSAKADAGLFIWPNNNRRSGAAWR